MQFLVKPAQIREEDVVILYENVDFTGSYQKLGNGAYTIRQLSIGKRGPRSLKLSSCKIVTFYEDNDFRQRRNIFTCDTTFIDDYTVDTTTAIVVQPVVEIYEEPDYKGSSHKLPTGRYNMVELPVCRDQIYSLKVPDGLMVTLFEEAGFQGMNMSFTQNSSLVSSLFNESSQSLLVEQSIPGLHDAIQFGDIIALTSFENKFMTVKNDKTIQADSDYISNNEEFVIVRAGNVRHNTYMNFGDCISLETYDGNFVCVDNDGNLFASEDNSSHAAQFIVWRSGNTKHMSLVNGDDIISLQSCLNKKFVTNSDKPGATSQSIHFKEQWNLIVSEKMAF
jgi:hypothetical protein